MVGRGAFQEMWWEYIQGGGGEKEGCFVGVLFVVFSLFQLRSVRVMVPSLGWICFLVVSRSPVFLGTHVCDKLLLPFGHPRTV